MPYDIVIAFKKPFIRCSVPSCQSKHYAKSYCENHYHKICCGKYRYTLDEYLNLKKSRQKKEPTKDVEKTIKNKTARQLYQKIKESNINYFQYKNIVDLTEWKYERVKKHILKLIKLNKIRYSNEAHGGRNNLSVFKLL